MGLKVETGIKRLLDTSKAPEEKVILLTEI